MNFFYIFRCLRLFLIIAKTDFWKIWRHFGFRWWMVAFKVFFSQIFSSIKFILNVLQCFSLSFDSKSSEPSSLASGEQDFFVEDKSTNLENNVIFKKKLHSVFFLLFLFFLFFRVFYDFLNFVKLKLFFTDRRFQA